MPLAKFADDMAAFPLFKGLSEAQKSELIKSGKSRTFARGEKLFMHGDPLHSFYLVIDGAIRQFRETPDGKEVTLHMALRGDMVCDLHVFESYKTYQWSAEAAEKTLVLEYPIFWFKEKVKTNPALALNVLAAMSHAAHMAAVEAEHMVTFTAAQRVACFLLRLCALYGFDPAGFDLPYSKTTIASQLGMELETFSRTLQTLKKAGVTAKGAHISIKDLRALQRYMCQQCSLSEDCPSCKSLEKCYKACDLALTSD